MDTRRAKFLAWVQSRRALRRVLQAVAAFGDFVWHVVARFWNDRGFGASAQLSYTTLLALIPLLAISTAILASYSVFDGPRENLLKFLLSNFLPKNVEAVRQQIDGFLKQTTQLSAIGTVALAVTAIILLDTVDTKFNSIWRQKEVRPLWTRIVIYWSMITLPPLLAGGSVALSTTLLEDAQIRAAAGGDAGIALVLQVLPFILLTAAFTLAYIVIPFRKVRFRHAVAGALVGAVLFEILKWGFSVYFSHFPAYQTLYGALSIIPLFLVWMYLGWCSVLFGAQIAASIPEWQGKRIFGGAAASEVTRKLFGAMTMLERLYRASSTGRPVDPGVLAHGLVTRSVGMAEIIDDLKAANIIVETESGKWLLARSAEAISLYDVFAALKLPLVPGLAFERAEGAWVERFDRALVASAAADQAALGLSIAEIFDDSAERRNPPDQKSKRAAE
jgi:membrane protein